MKAGRSASGPTEGAAASDAVAFSFYATKNLTTGEGGMVTTHRPDLAETMRMLSLHGTSHDAWDRYSEHGDWHYDVLAHGFKYNLSDIQAAIGIHQLKKLEGLSNAALYTPGCTITHWPESKKWSFHPIIPAPVMRGISTFFG